MDIKLQKIWAVTSTGQPIDPLKNGILYVNKEKTGQIGLTIIGAVWKASQGTADEKFSMKSFELYAHRQDASIFLLTSIKTLADMDKIVEALPSVFTSQK